MSQPEPSSDAALVRRTLDGDLGAFETLVGRYQQGVYNVAYYKSRNPFDAEDLAQDVFLAAFKALETLKDPDNFSGWLFGIAYNRCHKWYQRERSRVVKFQELRRRAEQEHPWRQGGSGLDDGDGAPPVSELLQGLPPDVRQALVLKYLEGRSYREIGEAMEIPFHRIDYLIRKGKKLVRERWEAREHRAAWDGPRA